MKHSILYKKAIVLTLTTILLMLSIHCIGYSQSSPEPSEELPGGWNINTERHGVRDIPITIVPTDLSVNHIYEKAIRSVIWIVTLDGNHQASGQASGVLIDKELRLAVTNEHVTTDHEWIWVCFPVRDKDGKFIEERDFYIEESNISVLVRLGYITTGRVVARDCENDLAIVELKGLPETAREIDHDFSYSVHDNMNRNDRVHVLGNPGDLKLWRWTGGFFETVSQTSGKTEELVINADTYQGNSGGPVLNERGMLIGIVSRSDLRTSTQAIPAKYVDDLLRSFAPKHIFSIQNNTSFTIHYEIKWSENGDWTISAVKPGKAVNHWATVSSTVSSINIPEEYPRIRFDYVANDEKFTYRSYELETYQRRAGSGFKPRFREDARKYHFEYNYVTEILDLRDSESSRLRKK